jgi:hypothetical protein
MDSSALLLALATAVLGGACSTSREPPDARTDAGVDGGTDSGSDAEPYDADAGDPADGGVHYDCHFDPSVDHRYVGGMGGAYCQFQTCPDQYQAMRDGGVAYGACGPLFVAPSDVCFDVCFPASELATLPDGGRPLLGTGPAAFCCGNGPACNCDEICWAPDAVEPPHCVPR